MDIKAKILLIISAVVVFIAIALLIIKRYKNTILNAFKTNQIITDIVSKVISEIQTGFSAEEERLKNSSAVTDSARKSDKNEVLTYSTSVNIMVTDSSITVQKYEWGNTKEIIVKDFFAQGYRNFKNNERLICNEALMDLLAQKDSSLKIQIKCYDLFDLITVTKTGALKNDNMTETVKLKDWR